MHQLRIEAHQFLAQRRDRTDAGQAPNPRQHVLNSALQQRREPVSPTGPVQEPWLPIASLAASAVAPDRPTGG
jgi:hypothetical protein